MRHKALATAIAALALIGLTAPPASAITDGVPDGNGHPNVGLMVAFVDGTPAWRCSGTLISPTLLPHRRPLHVRCRPRRDLVRERRARRRGEQTTRTSATSAERPTRTRSTTTPRSTSYDLGVVVLDEPVVMAEYGQLPDARPARRASRRAARRTRPSPRSATDCRRASPTPTSWKTRPSDCAWSRTRSSTRSTPATRATGR